LGNNNLDSLDIDHFSIKNFFELVYKPSLVHPMGLMIICLRLLLQVSWSDLPVHHMMRTTSLNLFDLAPRGVYKLNLFKERLVVSYTTFSPLPI